MTDATPNWFVRNNARIAAIGLGIVVLGTVIAMLAGPLYQAKLIALFPAFGVLRAGVIACAVGAAVGLLSLVISLSKEGGQAFTRNPQALVAIVVGLVVFYVPFSMSRGGFPPIHDVTTDIENPPAFVDALALRQSTGATNVAEYVRVVKRPNGTELNVPELQQKAFPDIQPVKMDVPPAEAYAKAMAAVKKMKWTIIADKPGEGRIEASDKTAWFGFIDDVVIRVQPDGAGSRVDVRSVSRIGFGDVGKNAKRIRAYVLNLTGARSH
ncbi:MAG: DUF1499 domain-containing protein [Rhodospirillaceae bacterium]|nr:DUF1499 domain-containing protein [Rhodospirillaceae bacterium]